MAEIKIAFINASTVLRDDEVEAALPGLQAQVKRDFAPVWGIDADLQFVPAGARPDPGAWWLVVLDDSDQAGALGYHDVTTTGLPLGKVFARTDLHFGEHWTVTASHELLEQLADPDVNLTVYVEIARNIGRLYAYEVCDACEAEQFAYSSDGVLVSDFVYPAWFETFRRPGSTRFDHGGHIQRPFQLLAGGYIGVLDLFSFTGWRQHTAQQGAQYSARARIGSRRERRRTPRHQWLMSQVDFEAGPDIRERRGITEVPGKRYMEMAGLPVHDPWSQENGGGPSVVAVEEVAEY